MKNVDNHSLTRRSAIAGLVAIGALGIANESGVASNRQQATPTADVDSATSTFVPASMPDWQFNVIEFQNDYEGTITRPDTVPEDVRIVAAQVLLNNASSQPLEFSVSDVRLRDQAGTEYRAGDYIGSEPRIVSQNLPDGERSRGWVWFAVPPDSDPAELVFVAPPPVLRVQVS